MALGLISLEGKDKCLPTEALKISHPRCIYVIVIRIRNKNIYSIGNTYTIWVIY
jgi:hypothetical protein